LPIIDQSLFDFHIKWQLV